MIKRVSAVLAIVLGTTVLADDAGACYRWKIWRYPFKQTCSTAASVMRPIAPAPVQSRPAPVVIKIPSPAVQDLAPSPTDEPFVIPPGAATEADERAWAVNELRKQLTARGM